MLINDCQLELYASWWKNTVQTLPMTCPCQKIDSESYQAFKFNYQLTGKKWGRQRKMVNGTGLRLAYFFFFFTILYWFCHTLTWILHGCTCAPHPEPPTHLPPHTIRLHHSSAPAPNTLYHASNLDWFVSHMIIYMFQCHSPKSSHPLPLPQSPKDCSIHLCLFYCLAYRVIVTIFLNSIYIH